MTTSSIIIAAYNAGGTLARAIDSALSQTVPPLEIIVVDDGSVDNTARVAKGYGDAVRFASQPNAGPSSARNRGIALARGELVAFLDADDELLPHMLETLTGTLARFPDAAAVSAPHLEERCGALTRVPPEGVVTDAGGAIVLDDFFETSRYHYVAWIGATLIRRSALQEVGGFRSDLRFGEDLDLSARIAARHAWAYVDDACTIYHRHPWSATACTPEHLKHIEWLMREERMRTVLPRALWTSYRRYRRDKASREARNALHQGGREHARRLLGTIAPAPLSTSWIVTELLARFPARPTAWLLRSVYAARSRIWKAGRAGRHSHRSCSAPQSSERT